MPFAIAFLQKLALFPNSTDHKFMHLKSLQHPLVKHLTLLRKDKAYRQEVKKILVIGETLILELKVPILKLISTKAIDIPCQESYLATPEILQKITSLDVEMAAEIEMPQETEIKNQQFVLILDRIQDPGNLGTLFRTAWALKWEAILMTPETVDPFNDKALRASQGASLQMPFQVKTPDEIIHWLKTKKIPLWVADAKGEPLQKISFQAPLALVLSHEGQGIGSWAKTQGKLLSIPLSNNVESLNVASAGAILLYTLRHS